MKTNCNHSIVHSFFSKLITALSIGLLSLSSCGDGSEEKPVEKVAESTADIVAPAHIVIDTKVDGKDAIYRVQVGDTLPNEQESIALFRKVSGIAGDKSNRNTTVFITREGFSAMADAHAYVRFNKDDAAPHYQLQTADNATLQKLAALTFNSISSDKLLVELLDAAGTKRFIFKKQGGFTQVIMLQSGEYDSEDMKAGPGHSADNMVLIKTEGGERFTYREDDTGQMMEVYNGNNSLFNAYKILKRG